MAFSFAELLKKQFPLAEAGVDTRGSRRMPESSPFPSTDVSMGGLIDALGGITGIPEGAGFKMADLFDNDNYEMRPTEASPKRGEDVLRPYRMRPGDKTTTEIDKNGNEVVTEKRVSPVNTSAQTFALGEGAVGDPTAIFRNEPDPRMSGDFFPQQPVIDPIQSFEGGRMPTNTVYPRPTTRSMYNRPVNSPDLMGDQGSVNNTGYRGTYGVPMYGQPRPTSAQTSPIINSLLAPELGDTAQSEMNRLPMLINQGEDGVFPPTGPNVYGLDEGMFNEDPDDERRRLLGELLREYYQTNGRTYTSSI